MSAPNPNSNRVSAEEYDHHSLSWINMDIPEVVEMAELQANESILVLACATGALILEIAQAYGGIHGRIVGVDPTMAAIQLARQKLLNMNLLGDKEFFRGNPYDMNGLRQALKAEGVSSHSDTSKTTFDVIFARNTLPSDSSECSSILHQLIPFLTPTSGRMIVTFTPHIDDTPSIAGIQVVNGNGDIRCQIRWILEEDWVEAENEFRALVGGAGLVVEGMKRIALQNPGAEDRGEDRAQNMRDYKWEGSKQEFLWESLDIATPLMKENLVAERGEVDIHVVPVNIKLVAVLKKDYMVEV